jgi:hypothetical protein
MFVCFIVIAFTTLKLTAHRELPFGPQTHSYVNFKLFYDDVSVTGSNLAFIQVDYGHWVKRKRDLDLSDGRY